MEAIKTGCAIECRGLTKSFGEVLANDDVNLSVQYGEILALLGENGSGKTTLMNMLSGIYHPDKGATCVSGQEVVINSPSDAADLGIGMIHQHFKLVDVFSAMDNIVLGTREQHVKARMLREKIKEKLTRNLWSGGRAGQKNMRYVWSTEKQTVEILKVLYRGAQILILDEPTAVLTPQEIEKLFDILRRMKEQGCAIIIITHKLNEVMAISDRVTVLRKGKSIATVKTAETNEQQLTELMVGMPVSLAIRHPTSEETPVLLKVVDLTVEREDGTIGLKDVSFDILQAVRLSV